MTLRALLSLLLCVSLAACQGAPLPEGDDARPALWEAKRGTVTISLFGTMHVVPREARWLGPVVRDAFADADALMLEIDDNGTAQERQALFDRLGQSGTLSPMSARIDPDRAARLDAALADDPATAHVIQAYEDWAAALLIGATSQGALDLSRTLAPETVFASRAKARTMPILALESRGGQLALFDTLPPAAQTSLLRAAIDEAADPRPHYDALYRAWSTGDMAGIEARFVREAARDPALIAALLTDRNRRWAATIDRLTAKRANWHLFVAVGAGHLAGAEGLPTLLARRGFTVRRIQ